MGMNPSDKKRILGFYEDSFAKYGNDPRSVHWSGKISQNVRFEILTNIAPLSGTRILDVGCGLGDLYKFFITKGTPVDYAGIDIVPAFVNRARERFPDAQFLLGDASSLDEDYDYILVSGALNFATTNSKEYYFAMIRNMFAHAKRGLAFNMLNEAGHQTDETYVSYNIGEVTRYAKTLTDEVVVVSDYLPWDFTVYMYKGLST